MLGQPVAEVRSCIDNIEQRGRLPVEAPQVAQHAPETRRRKIALLAKEAGEVTRVVFQSAALVVYRKTHGSRLRLDSKFGKQAGQERIVLRVEHDEAAVDCVALAGLFDLVRMGVPTEAVLGLKQHNLVFARQQPGRTESRDARSDDRNTHVRAGRPDADRQVRISDPRPGPATTIPVARTRSHPLPTRKTLGARRPESGDGYCANPRRR